MLVFLNYFDKINRISYTSHDGHFVLDSLSPAPCQRTDVIAFCLREDKESFILGIWLYFLSLTSSNLPSPLPFHPHLLPSVGSRWCCSIHDGDALSHPHSVGEGWKTNQIHLTSPQLLSLCQIEFEIFHLLSHLSLFLGTTWNYLEPSRLTTWWHSIIYAYRGQTVWTLLYIFSFKRALSNVYIQLSQYKNVSRIFFCVYQCIINILACKCKRQ